MMDPEQQLARFRQQIDDIDEQVTQLLLARCEVVRQVGELKAKHWPNGCYIRPGREGRMHEAIAERFKGTAIPTPIALSIWRQLIGASTSIESPLTATTLKHWPHHGWLVREYFGINAGLVVESSVAEMLDDIGSGAANLLLLPAPGSEGGDWWVDAHLFRTHQLSIFATLPVTTAPLPDGMAPALAMATVAPEPSGHDVSYLALTTKQDFDAAALAMFAPGRIRSVDGRHHLLVFEDFVDDTHPTAQSIRDGLGDILLSLTFLGAHPRPISL